MRDALSLTALALIPGVGGGIAAGYALQAMLYESTPPDWPALGTAVAVLGVTAIAAAWRPARWAAKVDPIVALRVE